MVYELHPGTWTIIPGSEVQFFMTKFSTEEKDRALGLIEGGQTIAEISRRTGISEREIGRFRQLRER
jgi:transposase-like protein